MKVKCFLTVNQNGSIRVSKGKPDLKWSEISVAVNLELPDMLFKKPHLEATIIIPEEAASPTVIDVDVANNIKEAIESLTGIEVKITIPEPEEG